MVTVSSFRRFVDMVDVEADRCLSEVKEMYS